MNETLLSAEQGLEAEATIAWTSGNRMSATAITARGQRLLKRSTAAPREKPLNRHGFLNAAAGRNRPASRLAEQAVERLREPEDGTKRALGAPAVSGCEPVMSR